MKDPFDLFIEDSVILAENNYYDLMYETKQVVFESLQKEISVKEFSKKVGDIWSKVDHSFMEQRIDELQQMIEQRDLQGNKIINPDSKYEEIYELISESKFVTVEQKFQKIIEAYYSKHLEIIKKEYIDKDSYLSSLVSKYDKTQQMIPYYNKDGTIHSYHTISSYNSMLYNVSLNHAGWNRTQYDAKLLGINIEYLPAHPYACPLCQPYQGKLYSNDGTTGVIDGVSYQPKEIAIENGVGHPNCKHQWLLYWDKTQIQEDKYDSKEWSDKYKEKQKQRAKKRKIKDLTNDGEIYKKLGNYEMVDKTNQKIEKLLLG